MTLAGIPYSGKIEKPNYKQGAFCKRAKSASFVSFLTKPNNLYIVYKTVIDIIGIANYNLTPLAIKFVKGGAVWQTEMKLSR